LWTVQRWTGTPSQTAAMELVLAQVAELERERDAVVESGASDKASKMIQQLASLRGIGVQSATVLVREAFVRRFANGKVINTAIRTPFERASLIVGTRKPTHNRRRATCPFFERDRTLFSLVLAASQATAQEKSFKEAIIGP
jgi:Asp/Glu/hydantoin racemase